MASLKCVFAFYFVHSSAPRPAVPTRRSRTPRCHGLQLLFRPQEAIAHRHQCPRATKKIGLLSRSNAIASLPVNLKAGYNALKGMLGSERAARSLVPGLQQAKDYLSNHLNGLQSDAAVKRCVIPKSQMLCIHKRSTHAGCWQCLSGESSEMTDL